MPTRDSTTCLFDCTCRSKTATGYLRATDDLEDDSDLQSESSYSGEIAGGLSLILMCLGNEGALSIPGGHTDESQASIRTLNQF